MSDASALLEQEEIRQQIDESRTALVEKLELLEEKVAETVQNATSTVAEATATVLNTVNNATASMTDVVENVNTAVQGTVDTVRNTVTDTVESVKHTFDLSEQVERHPWTMLAGAVALGYMGGSYLGQGSSGPESHSQSPSGWQPNPPVEHSASSHVLSSSPATAPTTQTWANQPEQAPVSSHSVTQAVDSPNSLQRLFGNELSKLKGLAIGVSLGLVRDMISESVPPSFRPQIAEVIDGFTEKLGGEHIRGPILNQQSTSQTT